MEESGSECLHRWEQEGRSEERCSLETPRAGGKRATILTSVIQLRDPRDPNMQSTQTAHSLTSGAHINKGVVDQNQLVEVELIGEALSFGFMKDPLVVVVSVRAQQQRR